MPWRRLAAPALIALGVLAFLALLPQLLTGMIGGRLRHEARARGLAVTWQKLEAAYPARLTLTGLTLTRAAHDTALRARHAEAALALAWPPHIARLHLADARIALAEAVEDTADTAWEPEADRRASAARPVDPRVRAAAQQIADLLLLPARRMPHLQLDRVHVARGARGAWIEALELSHAEARLQLSAVGAWISPDTLPAELHAHWRDDDTIGAQFRLTLPDTLRGPPQPLTFTLAGRLTQDRAAGELRLADGARLTVGPLAFTLGGRIARQGPRVEAAAAATGLDAAAIRTGLPRSLLGPLEGLEVSGTFDWQGEVALDVSQPDSVRFDARVVPHALALSPDSPLPLLALHGPFVARIHVPSGTVTRELSDANPHYRPLAAIAPTLRDAVLTNEDGGFWWHRGFNTQAIQLAIAENLRAGRFKRGAGTITMQLARNLFLGQQKTLARKGQEVVLAWSLEHLARLPKERLLEIYLNLIEWGPGVHGADEAAHWYFGKQADALTLDESLFLATLVPSPRRWAGRLTETGELRPWVREQMRFIAGKMQAKGWLDSLALRPADSLAISLGGVAATRFLRSDSTAAAPDSASADTSAIAAR